MAREMVGPNGAQALLPAVDTDLPFVQRIKAGDTEAFGPLWEKYERALYQFFHKRIGDRQEAEDLASETLVAALRAIPQFRGASLDNGLNGPEKNCSFKTFLQAIARHKLAHWIRRKNVRNEVRLEDFALSPHGEETNAEWTDAALRAASESEDDPLTALLATERRDSISYTLASLDSDRQFEVVLMHYLAGMNHQEVATALITRRETINTRLQDGRKAFQRIYPHFDNAIAEA